MMVHRTGALTMAGMTSTALGFLQSRRNLGMTWSTMEPMGLVSKYARPQRILDDFGAVRFRGQIWSGQNKQGRVMAALDFLAVKFLPK